jgi:glycosyltransferase involved in cell wall biosynthesis
MHGLPTIGHRHPVIEYVLGDVGIVADLAKEGALAAALLCELRRQKAEDGDPVSGLRSLASSASPSARWASVRDRFSWDVLRPHYAEMFRAAAEAPIPEA